MEAHDVIKRAKAWVTDIYAEEGIQNLGLEEIDYDEDERAWNVTLGFSRPWNTARNAITAITGEPVARRTYKIVKLSDSDGRVLSLHNRETQ